MSHIADSAIVMDGARLEGDVFIGPYCVVGPQVVLHDGVRLESHVVLAGDTRIGAHTRISPFASLGGPPQDLKYQGEPTRLVVGAHNSIREYVTMNIGTRGGGGVTRIGDHGLFMACAHVAHDCTVGNHCIVSQGSAIGGHGELGDYAIIAGICSVQQRSRIGDHAFISASSGVKHDVVPFAIAGGDRARLMGINATGLKRRGFSRADIKAIHDGYLFLFHGSQADTLRNRARILSEDLESPAPVRKLANFVLAGENRRFHLPRADRSASAPS